MNFNAILHILLTVFSMFAPPSAGIAAISNFLPKDMAVRVKVTPVKSSKMTVDKDRAGSYLKMICSVMMQSWPSFDLFVHTQLCRPLPFGPFLCQIYWWAILKGGTARPESMWFKTSTSDVHPGGPAEKLSACMKDSTAVTRDSRWLRCCSQFDTNVYSQCFVNRYMCQWQLHNLDSCRLTLPAGLSRAPQTFAVYPVHAACSHSSKAAWALSSSLDRVWANFNNFHLAGFFTQCSTVQLLLSRYGLLRLNIRIHSLSWWHSSLPLARVLREATDAGAATVFWTLFWSRHLLHHDKSRACWWHLGDLIDETNHTPWRKCFEMLCFSGGTLGKLSLPAGGIAALARHRLPRTCLGVIRVRVKLVLEGKW